MGLSFLTPFFLAGFLALAVPVILHLIRRHQGKTLEFPSLMFLRQLPVQSVKRRTIRDWPLLLLRAGALALIALAFARPVLQLGETEEGTAQDALREVVITLDRSWSMARGDRWERAVDEARSALNGLVNPDRVSLVVFDGTGRVVVEPTLDPGRVRQALDTIQPGWGGTQIGAGLQAASGILEASDRSRREVLLISDYQRRGWEDGPRDRLPAGTALETVDVGDDGLGSMIVSDVTLEHTFAEGRQRVRPVARVIRQGEQAPSAGELILEIDGREEARRPIELSSEGAAAVAFDPFTLPEEGLQGFVRLEPEGAESAEPFRFVVSPREVLSILLVAEGVGSAENPYLLNALNVPGGPPVRVETSGRATIGAAELTDVDLVVFNDMPLPSGAAGNVLRDYVRSGGGLLVVAGPASDPTGWEEEWTAFLPGRVGATVERNPARGASLAQVNRDHPIFTPFRGVGGTGLGTPRFFRYREFDVHEPPSAEEEEGPSPDALNNEARVLAGFDDGSAALAERGVGAGRVLVWTSTLDNSWTDFALHPVFVPVVREIAQYAAARTESVPYFTVGQPVDARFLLTEAGILQEDASTEGAAQISAGADGEAVGVLVDPEGGGTDLGTVRGQPIQLSEPGFYEVREDEDGSEMGWILAANPDVREADPARIDPEELALAASPAATESGEGATAAGNLEGSADPRMALADSERRQGAWRFLLLGAILLLLGETFLAGRRKPLAREV